MYWKARPWLGRDLECSGGTTNGSRLGLGCAERANMPFRESKGIWKQNYSDLQRNLCKLIRKSGNCSCPRQLSAAGVAWSTIYCTKECRRGFPFSYQFVSCIPLKKKTQVNKILDDQCYVNKYYCLKVLILINDFSL